MREKFGPKQLQKRTLFEQWSASMKLLPIGGNYQIFSFALGFPFYIKVLLEYPNMNITQRQKFSDESLKKLKLWKDLFTKNTTIS